MIGFAMLGTNDLAAARGFYGPLAALLGASLNPTWGGGRQLWYATSPTGPMLVLTTPRDGRPATVGNGSMVALAAKSRDVVDAVHAAALSQGGADEGPPGKRSDAPEDLYRAYFRDLDGNKLMVFTMAAG